MNGDPILTYGLPTVMLLSLAGWHVRTVLRHAKELEKKDADHEKKLVAALKEKDEAFIAMLREKDSQIAAKNEEIKRLNEENKRVHEARINDAQGSAERMLGVATEFTKLTGETNQTLAVLAERMPTKTQI